MRRAFAIAAAGVMASLVLLCAGCTRTPPEEALRATIAAMETAAEARDAAAPGCFPTTPGCTRSTPRGGWRTATGA